MSKRVRTSRIANSKKVRRARPSGEREVTGRKSLSSVDFDDRSSLPPSEAPPGVEVSEEDRTSSDDLSAKPSSVVADALAPDAIAPDVIAAGMVDVAIVPALVTGDTPPPPAVSLEEIVPASGELTPPPPAVAPVAAAPSEAPVGGKKKKKKGALGGTRPEDANASSGALSLNEPLARGFYESAPPSDQLAHGHGHDDEAESAHAVVLSPEILERKARLRRIVMGVFAAATLVVILVAGKTLLSKSSAPQTDATHAVDSTPAPAPKADETPKPEAPKVAEAPKPAAPAPETSAKVEEPKKDEAKADDAKIEEKKEEPAAPKGDPAELKKKASKLYNSGKLKEAIPALRDAIAADPEDALLYLFLGDALTNTGKWPDAKEAFNECVRKAKKGPKHECSAMGGHK